MPDVPQVLGDCSAGHYEDGGAALLCHMIAPGHVGAHAHALHAIPQQPVQRLHCEHKLWSRQSDLLPCPDRTYKAAVTNRCHTSFGICSWGSSAHWRGILSFRNTLEHIWQLVSAKI